MSYSSGTSTAELDHSETDESVSPSRAVGLAAGRLDPENQNGLSAGDRAALRRVDPDTPITPTLWKVLFDLKQAEVPRWISQGKWEQRWAALLMGMAHCAGLHRYDVPLGQALANAQWSETRFVRLLEADEDTLPVLIRRMAEYLSSKRQAANWDDVRRMLFYQSGDTGEDIRLDIARSYYRALYAREKDE